MVYKRRHIENLLGTGYSIFEERMKDFGASGMLLSLICLAILPEKHLVRFTESINVETIQFVAVTTDYILKKHSRNFRKRLIFK